MKKTLLIVLLIMFNVSVGQIIVPDTSKMTNTDKMLWYQNEKKSPARAFFYSWLIPTSGHAYAGDWKRGLKYPAYQCASITAGILYFNKGKIGTGSYRSSKSERTLWVVLPLCIGIRVSEFLDVSKAVNDYNQHLYAKLFGKNNL